jgi:hypothetical protein
MDYLNISQLSREYFRCRFVRSSGHVDLTSVRVWKLVPYCLCEPNLFKEQV